MPHELTAEISYVDGVYDVFVNYPDGGREKVLYGNAHIEPHVVKPVDGKILYMIGIGVYSNLPEVGEVDRLYFCYEDRKIYRWNGTNYVATAVGNGIKRIEFKEHSSPFTDTYTIIYDDGSTWDYQVTAKGIERIELIDSTGDYIKGITDTYRIFFNSGDHYDYVVRGGRIIFPIWDVDFETGYLTISDEAGNISWSISEVTGMLSYSY